MFYFTEIYMWQRLALIIISVRAFTLFSFPFVRIAIGDVVDLCGLNSKHTHVHVCI